MTTYYMTIYRPNASDYWEPCKAKTLIGAKREATQLYAGEYRDSVLQIAEGDGIRAERRIIAEKTITSKKWISKEG